MAARFARTFINTASRTSLRHNAVRNVVGRRLMSSSHGQATEASSDKPWAIASALVFGPMLLYLVSPSARKNVHNVHNDAHDYPGHHAPQSQQVVMKDSEGTPADVTESIKKAEVEDVPKAEPAQVSPVDIKLALVEQVTPEASPAAEPQSTSEVNAGIAAEDSKSSTSQSVDAAATPAQTEETPAAAEAATEKLNAQQEEKPTDVGAAREAAVEHVPPKEQAAKEA